MQVMLVSLAAICNSPPQISTPVSNAKTNIDPLVKEVLFISIYETQENSEIETNLQLLAVEK